MRTTVQIPPCVKDENGKRTNGVAEVDSSVLADLRKKDAVVRAWFDSGDLVVVGSSAVVESPKDSSKK